MSQHNLETFETEIKNELQLERMILFSDAVFAIVITLLAIELRIPESDHKFSAEEWMHITKHLFTIFISYLISFFFIGMIWYRHLKMFALLKDYDGGLVARNMILLFCIGLFPFGVSVAASPNPTAFPFMVYACIVILCMAAQYALQRYILIQRPELRNDHPIDKQLIMLKLSGIVIVALLSTFILVTASYTLLDKEDKPLAFIWFLLFAATVRITRRKYNSQLKLKTNPAALTAQ